MTASTMPVPSRRLPVLVAAVSAAPVLVLVRRNPFYPACCHLQYVVLGIFDYLATNQEIVNCFLVENNQ
jgi:hypothetical protein